MRAALSSLSCHVRCIESIQNDEKYGDNDYADKPGNNIQL